MPKVAITATLPTARQDASTVPVAEISGITFEQKLESAPVSAWSKLGPDIVPTVNPTVFVSNNVPPGKWHWRVTFHDKLGGPDRQVTTPTLDIGVSPLVGGSASAAVVP